MLTAEQQEYIQKNIGDKHLGFELKPSSVTFENLGNFHVKLFQWWRETFSDDSEEFSRKTIREVIGKDKDNLKYSSVFLDNTMEHFIRTIDEVLTQEKVREQAEMLVSELEHLEQEKKSDSVVKSKIDTVKTRLKKMLVPVYMSMRSKGYNHTDMWT